MGESNKNMKKMIVNEHEIIFDSEDAHLIEGHSWAVTKNRNIFYARNGKQYMHRIVMNAKRGSIIDHINGNGLDNRKSNLRLASHQMNKANSTAKNSTSSFIGVSFKKERVSKPYRAMAKDNGKVKHLGYFRTEEEAARAYDTFVRTKYGEMAICNFKETESQNEMECQLCGQTAPANQLADTEGLDICIFCYMNDDD